jgi:hypothetical protein
VVKEPEELNGVYPGKPIPLPVMECQLIGHEVGRVKDTVAGTD